MKYCVYCGKEIDFDTKVCPRCSKDVTDESIEKNFNANVECIKCESKNVNYQIKRTNRNDIVYEEEIYTCQNCGKQFKDKDRLGTSFNNNLQIIIGTRMKKLLKWVIIIGIVVVILYSNHLKGLKNENGTYYPYSIIDNVETTKEIFQIGEELYCENKTLIVNSVNYPRTIAGKTPSEGKKYITINVTIKNISEKSKFYGSSDFEILLSNGEKVSSKISAQEGDITSDHIDSGQTMTGNVNFEIPSTETNPTLNYYCDYWIDELIAKVELSK